MPLLTEGEVLANEAVAPGHFRMRLRAPDLAREAAPGQFAMLQVAHGLYPFLRRPMSFERIFPMDVTFLYKVRGEGTQMLSRFHPGQKIPVQGPLGNGFPITPGFKRHIIVAGGIGVAPFPGLAAVLIRRFGKAPEIVLAARTASLILSEDDFRQMGCDIHIATDDGTAGTEGLASDVLEQLAPDAATRVYACGPMVMLRAVAEIAATGKADCQVSLEAQMACGEGACLGCVVESVREQEGERMIRVCIDGPVFDGTLIDWEAHDPAYDR